MSSPPTARRPRPAADAGLLFDEPGPRGRRRIAVVSVVVTVVVLGLLAAALHQLAANTLLQGRDGLGQAGLADSERGGGLAEVLVVAQRYERPQLGEGRR